MIPEFPAFKKLELVDRPDVDSFTRKHIPHSDFNFVGMWTWDIEDERELSILNNNLVVKFTDYLTGVPFYSYLGNKEVSDTIEKLLELSQKEEIQPRLRYISEDSLGDVDTKRFKFEEDRDHFDYILDNAKLVDYEDKELKEHAGSKRRFMELYTGNLITKVLDLNHEEDQQSIFLLNNKWAQNKSRLNKDVSSESAEDIAIRKIFDIYNESFISVGIFHKTSLVAYIVDEVVRDDSLICHFMKADTSYRGIYSYLVSEAARVMLERGKRYVNLEQDLGLENLRRSKTSYAPIKLIKKYTVSRIT